MPDKTNIYGWTGSAWVPLLANAAGKLIIDPSEILEATPTDGETAKAAQSNWSFDHNANPNAHHAAFTSSDHTAIGDAAPHHPQAHTLASHTTKAHSELTGIGSSDHHVRYADSEAIAAAKTDATLLNYTQGARVYDTIGMTIPNNSWQVLLFNSERYDTDTIHSTTLNTSRLTCKTAGKYIIVGNVYFAVNATGFRFADILLNGATQIGESGVPAISGAQTSIVVTTIKIAVVI